MATPHMDCERPFSSTVIPGSWDESAAWTDSPIHRCPSTTRENVCFEKPNSSPNSDTDGASGRARQIRTSRCCWAAIRDDTLSPSGGRAGSPAPSQPKAAGFAT